MHRILACLLVALLLNATAGRAGQIKDATGRTVSVPDHPMRVLPAGPPAAVLLAALAPDLMIGWPHHPSPEAMQFLVPELDPLPQLPRLAYDGAAEEVKKLHPDLVLDYGDITPRYADFIKAIQDHSGIPAILLDGHLTATPQMLREAGRVLGRPERAELLARVAEDLLAAAPKAGQPLRVVYVRGIDPPLVAQPGTLAMEVLSLVGWTVVAPPSTQGGTFRPSTVAEIAALQPDMVMFHDEDARAAVAKSVAWSAVPAVKAGHILVSPEEPFGWVEEPPSINRLIGLAWLSEHGGAADGALLSALLFNHVPDPAAVARLRDVLDGAPK